MCGGQFQAVFVENGAHVIHAAFVRHGRPGGNVLWRVARYVADEQGDDARRLCRLRQPPALDGGEVFADDVHLADGRAAVQQLFVDQLFVGERQPFTRQRE